jgi:hypothetical protein
MKYSKEEIAHEKENLLKWCPKKATIYTSLEHVSRSGMQRSIKLYVVVDGRLYHISYCVAVVLGRSRKHNRDGVTIDGCGMDMGFDLVYSLGRALYKDGYAFDHRWI